MANPYPQSDSHYSITDEHVIPLVCSMIGVPETLMRNAIKDIEKESGKPKTAIKKVPKQLLTKKTSFECLVIKTLIQIEKQNGPERTPSLEHYRTKLKERFSEDFSPDEIKKLLKVIGLKWMDESTQKSDEIYIEENTEDVEMHEIVNTEEYSLEDIKLGDTEIEIKTEIEENIVEESSSEVLHEIEIKIESELNNPEPAILQNSVEDYVNLEADKEESSSELEDEIEIKTESELNYSDPAILRNYVEDNVNLEADKEFNEINVKSEFCDIEDALQSHVILRKDFVENLLIKQEENIEVQTESDSKPAIIQDFVEVQDFVDYVNVKTEEEFNENHLKAEDSQQSNNELACAEEEVQLEFVDIDDFDGTTDTDNYVNETQSHLPTLDYFVNQLSSHYSRYPKSFVAKWLKRLQIRFQNDYHMDTTVQHLINDPTIPRFLNQFNLFFYFNKDAIKNEDNNLETQTDDLCESIDPKIEEIITDIAISCQKQGVIPSFTLLLSKVQSYDKNVDTLTLEEWLKKLKIIYHRNHYPKYNLRKIKRPFENKGKIPFEYFYNHISLTMHKCSKGTLKKWLELLKINFVCNNSDPELKCRKTKDKISPPVVKILLNLEKKFYSNQQLIVKHIANEENLIRETRDAGEGDTEKNTKIAPPSLDFFYNTIKVCCKSTLKKWLEFLNIKFVLNNCDLRSECKEKYYLPHPSIIKQIEQLDENFYKPKEAEHDVLIPIVEELYSNFQGYHKVLTLDFIYNFIISSEAFDTNLTCSKTKLKEWLKARKINFLDEDSIDNKEKVPSFFYDSLQLPTLDYFYTNINENRYVCSKSTLKRWLDCLTIKYESEDNIIEPKHKRTERLTSTTIINRLIKLEEQFNKNKILSLMLIESLMGIAKEHKNRCKVPTLDVFHQYVVNSKLFKTKQQGYNKKGLKWVLNHLKINYKTSEEDELSIPTIDYFYEQLKARGLNNISHTQVKIWLDIVGIKFKKDTRDLDVNITSIDLSSQCIKLLHEIDLEFRVKKLITHLKKRDTNMNSKRWKPPSFKKILNIINKYDLFDTDINAAYKKSVLKKWVQKLGVKFVDEEEEKPQLVPPLDYFYEKLTEFEGNVCTKDTLAQWLCQIRVQFKEKDSIVVNTNEIHEIPSHIINILWKLSKFYHLSDVEHIFKKIFEAFQSRNQTPSIEFLQKKLFELKSFHSNKRDLKQWLDYVGIKFQNKRYRDQIENEVDRKIKRKCTSFFETKTKMLGEDEEDKLETQILEVYDDDVDDDIESEDMVTEEKMTEILSTQVLNINNSEKYNDFVTEADMLVLEQPELKSESQIIEIEEDSMDSDIETPDVIQQTEIIEIEDDDDIPVNQQSQDPQPSTSNNDPLLILDQNTPLLLVIETQQPEIPQIPKFQQNESSKSLQNQRKSSKSDETPKSVRKNNSAPDDVMKLLTDVEYNYYKMKKIPTLDQFYDPLVKAFDQRYSKEILERWLKKAGIRFKIPESFEYLF